MPNMKSLSLTVQKVKLRLKSTTDKQTDKQTNRQTGQKQYAPDHSIRGIKILVFHFIITFNVLKQWKCGMLGLHSKDILDTILRIHGAGKSGKKLKIILSKYMWPLQVMVK